MGDLVRDQVYDQVGDLVRDQVYDQVGAQVRHNKIVCHVLCPSHTMGGHIPPRPPLNENY